MMGFFRVSEFKLFKVKASLKSLLKDILNIEINEVTLSEDELKIIEIVKRKKKLILMIRRNRKIDVVKTKVAIIKALSFVRKIFNSLWEICKKLGTIFGACRFIFEIVELVNQFIHKKSRNGSFLFVI